MTVWHGGLFGHVKSAVRKICFSRGVALPYAPMSLAWGWGGLFGHGKFGVIQKWCSILVQTHEILAGIGKGWQ